MKTEMLSLGEWDRLLFRNIAPEKSDGEYTFVRSDNGERLPLEDGGGAFLGTIQCRIKGPVAQIIEVK